MDSELEFAKLALSSIVLALLDRTYFCGPQKPHMIFFI